jgi:hypothetical protein
VLKSFCKAAVLAVAVGSLNLAVVAPAEAQVGVAEGRRCSFNSITDPTLEGDAQTGQINGGPLVATAPAATIQMTCTIQVGANTHNGGDACAAPGPASLQVGFVTPTACTYDSPEGVPVYMCTQATINGVTYYWDAGPPDPGTGTWSTSSASYCNEALSVEIFPGPICTVTPQLYVALGGNGTDPINPDGQNLVVIGPDGDTYAGGIWIDCLPRDNPLPPPPGGWFPDPLICGPLASLSPGVPGVIDINSEGDVAIAGEPFWDCPPYTPPTV